MPSPPAGLLPRSLRADRRSRVATAPARPEVVSLADYRREVEGRANELGYSLPRLMVLGAADKLTDDPARDLYLEAYPILEEG